MDAFGDAAGEPPRAQMAPRIERDNALRVDPLLEWPDRRGGGGVGEVRPPDRIERARGYGKRAIDRIGATVGADDVAILRARHGAAHRSTPPCPGGSPMGPEVLLGSRPGT